MRTLKFALAATLVAIPTIATSAGAAPAPKATGGVTSPGAAENGNAAFKLTFTAQDPAAPKGNFTFTRAEGSFTADVTCYRQTDHRAGFSGPIKKATGSFAGMEGSTAYAAVEDNGEGSKATAPDRVQVDIGEQFADCSPNVFPYAADGGNVQVHR